MGALTCFEKGCKRKPHVRVFIKNTHAGRSEITYWRYLCWKCYFQLEKDARATEYFTVLDSELLRG